MNTPEAGRKELKKLLETEGKKNLREAEGEGKHRRQSGGFSERVEK